MSTKSSSIEASPDQDPSAMSPSDAFKPQISAQHEFSAAVFKSSLAPFSASSSVAFHEGTAQRVAEHAAPNGMSLATGPVIFAEDTRPAEGRANELLAHGGATPLYGESSDVDSQALIHDDSGAEEFPSSDLSEPPTDLEDNRSLLKKPESAKKKYRRRNIGLNHGKGPLDATAFLASQKRSASIEHLGQDRSKKIKITSPMKHRPGSAVDLGVLPSDTKYKMKGETETRTRTRDDDQNSNDEHCSACRGTGKLLCCDDCPRSFHFSCIEPPIEEADIPDEPYFCMSCWERRYGFPDPPPGLFRQLMKIELTKDPSMFLLPAKIRNFFENVSTGEAGEYVEAKDQKAPRKDRHGFAEEVDPLRLRDRQSQPILCYRCGESAMASAGMASCDHCSSHWHFDCLDPPLSGPPLSTKKWMCPLHAHELTPTSRIPKDPHIVNVSLRRGFANNGDVDVDLESDVQESTASESASDIGEESQTMAKAIHMPRVKYRLPEAGVALDFLDTCRRTRESEGHKLLDVLTARPDGIVRESLLHALIDVVLTEHEQVVEAEQERSQLLALKSLMAVKGKDQLVKFLAG